LDNAISTWKRRLHIAQRIISKNFFRLCGIVNKLFQPKENFFIKKGYHHAAGVIDFDDTSNTDEWQKEVYLLARDILSEKNYQSVIDVGCGSAYKLIHYLGSYKTIGIEVESTYKWLKQKYPEHEWQQFDKTDPATLQADLIICSDVIEHIKNPDSLIEFISRIQSKQIIFSTPERNAVAGKNDYGPPENPAHFREWDADEFKNYISRYFVIQEQRIFNGKSVTQVITCKK
jgi:hypothetical protein